MGAPTHRGPEQMQAGMHGVLREDSLGMAHSRQIAGHWHSPRGLQADASFGSMPQRQDSFPALFSPHTPHTPHTPALFTGMSDEGLGLFQVITPPQTPRPAALNLLLLDQA